MWTVSVKAAQIELNYTRTHTRRHARTKHHHNYDLKFIYRFDQMDSKIGFEMSLIVVEAIRGRCASFMILTATVSEIFGGQTNSSI